MQRRVENVSNLHGKQEIKGVYLRVERNIEAGSTVSVSGKLYVEGNVGENARVTVTEYGAYYDGGRRNSHPFKDIQIPPSTLFQPRQINGVCRQGFEAFDQNTAKILVNGTLFTGKKIWEEDEGIHVDGVYYPTTREIFILGSIEKNVVIKSEYPLIIKGNVGAGVEIQASQVTIEGATDPSAKISKNSVETKRNTFFLPEKKSEAIGVGENQLATRPF